MSDPALARTAWIGGQRYRVYKIDGEKLPSVTSVLKQLAAPALVNWLQDQVALAAIRKTEWREEDEETAREMLRSLAKGISRRAMNLGTIVHELIEDEVALDDIADERLVPYLLAAATAMRYMGDHWRSEVTLVDTVSGYAGTADVLAYRPDQPSELMVVDWKSTKADSTAGWRNHQLQLAALSQCPQYADDDGTLHDLPAPITALMIVALKPDGLSDVRILADPRRIEALHSAFLGLLELVQLDVDYPRLEIWEESHEDLGKEGQL